MTGSTAISEPSNSTLKSSGRVRAMLECVRCYAPLKVGAGRCDCSRCDASYPVCDGIAVLIDNSTSLFRTNDFTERKATFFRPHSRAKRLVLSALPEISHNIRAKANYRKFAELVLERSKRPIVLVVGGSIPGKGMEEILACGDIEFVETDVSFGPRTSLICDAHQLPFSSESFDGVLVQAVLEHVLDPPRCVEEIYRVLNARGLVYAETPFMQQVHGREYDFTRFTHLGHRRLFRKFEEISSGAACGPGMALAWSYTYFLLSFASSRIARAIIIGFARLTAFWVKYFDFLLIDKPAALDSASGYYFIGCKSEKCLTDQELIQLYRGAF
jgi:SAM-dependent methyltransferase